MKKLVTNLKGKTESADVKKIIKVSSAGALALLLLGGGSAFAYKKYDESQDLKEKQAQTTLIQNQAKAENVLLKSEDEIKNAVAQVVGTDASAITFKEISLSDGTSGKSGKGERGKGNRDFDSRSEVTRNVEATTTSTSNEQSNTSNLVSTSHKYVYNVKANANSMDYRFSVDATSGKVISSKVKN